VGQNELLSQNLVWDLTRFPTPAPQSNIVTRDQTNKIFLIMECGFKKENQAPTPTRVPVKPATGDAFEPFFSRFASARGNSAAFGYNGPPLRNLRAWREWNIL
jgi:hypothetical protein